MQREILRSVAVAVLPVLTAISLPRCSRPAIQRPPPIPLSGNPGHRPGLEDRLDAWTPAGATLRKDHPEGGIPAPSPGAGRILEETGRMEESASPVWWLSSGGYLHYSHGVARTGQGRIPEDDRWRLAYAASNPTDTDGGYRPQNIFRLVTRGKWKQFRQELHFRIRRTNPSSSPNRAGHNGVLLFHRYLDCDNLYYAGVRADGAAVVKKKLAGVYTTLAFRKLHPGEYDRAGNPNLLPHDRWIGLRTTIGDEPGGGVAIRLEIDDPIVTGGWILVLEALDSSPVPIRAAGHAGIRSDFMDLDFDGYRVIPFRHDTRELPGRHPDSWTGQTPASQPPAGGRDD